MALAQRFAGHFTILAPFIIRVLGGRSENIIVRVLSLLYNCLSMSHQMIVKAKRNWEQSKAKIRYLSRCEM